MIFDCYVEANVRVLVLSSPNIALLIPCLSIRMAWSHRDKTGTLFSTIPTKIFSLHHKQEAFGLHRCAFNGPYGDLATAYQQKLPAASAI